MWVESGRRPVSSEERDGPHTATCVQRSAVGTGSAGCSQHLDVGVAEDQALIKKVFVEVRREGRVDDVGGAGRIAHDAVGAVRAAEERAQVVHGEHEAERNSSARQSELAEREG